MLKKTTKSRIVSEHRVHKTDTGSADVQIALISKKIDELASHLKKHTKDTHSRRGLLGLVSQRRKLLAYLAENTPERHAKLIKKLGLKK